MRILSKLCILSPMTAFPAAEGEEIFCKVCASNLLGRGWTGFPVAEKWRQLKEQQGEKEIVCLLSGDCAAALMATNPEAVFYGTAIAARAFGETRAWIVCDREYPMIPNEYGGVHLQTARIPHSLSSGEETRVFAAVEGGTPIAGLQPPYPVQRGLFGRPTLIQSGELLAHLPYLLAGEDQDTKIVQFCGDIADPGFAEIRLGTPLSTVIQEAGVKEAKAVQVGGPNGAFLSAESIVPFVLGSEFFVGDGSIRIISWERCMAQEVYLCLEKASRASCGKCVFCREGLYQQFLIWRDLVGGKAVDDDWETIRDLAEVIVQHASCGFGRSAGKMILSALALAPEEIEQHITRKRCAAMVCPGMFSLYILGDKCQGCGLCKERCGMNAISGVEGLIHLIDQGRCTQCLDCLVCPYTAMQRIPAKALPPAVPDRPIPVGSFVPRKKGLQKRAK